MATLRNLQIHTNDILSKNVIMLFFQLWDIKNIYEV